ncbi:hypothetical protein NK553_24650 [Pseudomonas sp. ZM23]|uniref:Lipoprotein n=1 Tax=Pseudomonas triclosanedens TaxID=2961893 RepID=A0ABY6ZRX5_9PSED|nr:hypothetical protein [Pseudomonas triclosanedens]MCP8467149.1 hypothetical protein [Pseudomonas triclosanedens]MCP8472702.1 hypothetical protein [Pseudomonas triclosanedens]MCP8478133.1 hypothetical protein [Pseudomonas triclosanedens]WAI47541.1 hypothetical protein OU419_17355 [Pseudomonas triclosanedens]
MKKTLPLALLLVAGLGLAACDKKEEPKAPAATEQPSTPAPTTPPAPEAAPATPAAPATAPQEPAGDQEKQQ